MAAPISITIPHQLGKNEARARIEAGFHRLKGQMAGFGVMNLKQDWEGDRLSFTAQALAQTFRGRLDVGDKEIRIEVDLPAFLANLADRIAGKLKKEGALLLEPPKGGPKKPGPGSG